jgi:predicted nucleotidyltransferase
VIELKPKDRDFIESVDGHMFCVVGYLHPPDGYTAYLKYVPSPGGKWERDGIRYSRSIPYYQVSQVENTYDYLKQNHTDYILKCPVRNIEISWVPLTHVKTYFKPRERVSEIKSNGAKDPLEEKMLKLTTILEESAGIEGSIGVTGSILTKTHNPEFSDIDLTVYGQDESFRLKETLNKLKDESEEVNTISEQEKGEWIINRLGKYELDAQDLMRAAEKRWNFGYFDGVYFSIHPIRIDAAIIEDYRDNTYHRVGKVAGTAVISDSSESIYLPALYKITDCEPCTEVSRIISFEGLYGSLFERGEKIDFNGILEEVRGKNPHKRIIIGGAGSPDSYIKWTYYSE